MGTNSPDDEESSDTLPERRLRGEALEGSDQDEAADHVKYNKKRNPDTELHLDGEKDSLYDDGLEIDEEDSESDTLAGTRGAGSTVLKP
jgi:hypothetical protein